MQQGAEGDGTPQTRLRTVEQEGSAPRSPRSTLNPGKEGQGWCAIKWPSASTLAMVLAVLSLVITAHIWGGQSYITNGMLWMREHEQQGRVLFVLAYTACLILLLPASVLALLAGACFGLFWGVALVYLANIIGQTIAFLLARSYLHDRLYAMVTSTWPQFTSIDAALRREGWRLVFVLRLSPCIPFVLINYALGLTSISFLEYSLASAVAIIPFVVISVYLGLASGTALQLLESSRWSDRSDRSLINPQSSHSASKSIAQHATTRKFSPPPPAPNLSDALTTVVATAESTGMYRDEDAGMQGASTTLVTVATCILAVVTGLYAAWFIHRVTSQVQEEVSSESVGGIGGLVGLSFAESSAEQSGPHREALNSNNSRAPLQKSIPSATHAEKRDASNRVAGWQSPSDVPFQAVPCETLQPVNGEGEQLLHAKGHGSGRHSREPSVSSTHSSLQHRSIGHRWSGHLTTVSRNIAQAARTAVGAIGQPGAAQNAESSAQLIGIDKR